MFNSKSIKILYIGLISLQSVTALSSQISETRVNQAVHRYSSIYENSTYGLYKSAVDDFTELVNRHPDLFNHLAEIETDLELLPYLEKYLDIKTRITGHTINRNPKVAFSRHPFISPDDYFDNINIIRNGIVCDYFSRTVFVDRGLWDHHQHNERIKEAVVFHGLGHCELNRDHTWEEGSGFSFMNPDIYSLIAFNPTTIADFGYNEDTLTEEQRLSYEAIIEETRFTLNSLFELMYHELFVIPNGPSFIPTQKEPYFIEGVYMTPEEFIEQFKNFIPSLKHMTIGPSRGTVTPF